MRADALNMLAIAENKAANVPVYTQALNDSSYAVVAAAIEGLTTAKQEGLVATPNQFRKRIIPAK